ncbi:hypothetical protein D3C80_1421520 [compost metagenome]
MLANVSSYNGFAFGSLIDHFNDPLRLKLCVRIIVAERFLKLPLGDLCSPGIRLSSAGKVRNKHFQYRFYIAYNRNIRCNVLADFRRINVDVDNLRFWSKAVQLTGYTVIEPSTDVNEQITLLYGIIGCIGTVHTRHSHPKIISTWEAAEAKQCRRNRDFRPFNKFIHRFMCPGVDNSSACNNNWAFSC